MSYRSTTKEKNSFSVKNFLLVLAVSTLIFTGLYLLKPLFFLGLVSQRTVTGTANNTLVTTFSDKVRLQEKVEDLEDQLVLAEIRSNQDSSTTFLSSVASTTTTEAPEGIFAAVLLAPPVTPYDSYLISAGARNGVRQGQLVATWDSIALGYVSTVSENGARVTLFSQSGERTYVRVGNSLVRAFGNGGGLLFVRLPRSFADTKGQEVRLVSDRDYRVGTLVETRFDPQDSFVSGYITLDANIFETARVVVTNETRPITERILEKIRAQEEISTSTSAQ